MCYSYWFGYQGGGCVIFILVWLSGLGLCVIHAGLVIRAGAVCYSYWFGYQGGGSVLFMLVWLSGWRQCTIHAGLVIRLCVIHAGLVIRAGAVCYSCWFGY